MRNSWSVPQFDIPRDPKERVTVEGWIQRSVAVDLLKSAGLDYDQLKLGLNDVQGSYHLRSLLRPGTRRAAHAWRRTHYHGG